MTLAGLIAIYFVTLAAAVSPGPAVLLAARTALREGLVRGVFLSIGIALGACVWAAAALFGMTVLFEIAPNLLTVLKVIGGGYLAFLAYKMWRHAPEPLAADLPDGKTGLSKWGLVQLGLMTQLANPKPALFFGTVFLTFIPANPAIWAYPAVLGIIFLNECGWNILVSRIFSLDRTRTVYMSLKTMIDRVFSGLLAALSVKLVLS